jgi:hypothetical protein
MNKAEQEIAIKALERIAAMRSLPIGSQQEEMSTRLEAAAIASKALEDLGVSANA